MTNRPMRTRTVILSAALFAGVIFVGAGCGAKPGAMSADKGGLVDRKGDISEDICREFTADFVYSATGKTIVRVEPSPIAGVFACDYFTAYDPNFYKLPEGKTMPGGPHISIVLDNLNVEKQKEGIKYLGGAVETDPRIKMDHWIVRRSKDNSVWGVHLVLNPDRFVWTDSLNKAATDEEIIDFAAKMAEKIQGKLSFKIKTNPVDLAAAREAELGASQEAAARSFFDAVAGGKTDDALTAMDANDQTKAMWKTNFAAIRSLKISGVEPAFKEEWTPTRQVFKFTLDVKVTPQGEEFGWSNGKNSRWLTLEKKGDVWRVTELANNP